MMQAFEQEMRSLRRAIRHWLGRIGWPRDAQTVASEKLARDLGLPGDVVTDILDRTAADLRKLSSQDAADIDARPIIDRAVQELAKFGFHTRPLDETVMDHYLQELPDCDYQILLHFKQGKTHREIAELLGTNVDSVRGSLIRTYAELRVRMLDSSDTTDVGMQTATQPSASSFNKPMNQTSVRHN